MVTRGANKLIKLGWIGAGGINFGSLEGPWNHAVRMQKQNNVQFTAIVDPNVDVAQVTVESCANNPRMLMYPQSWLWVACTDT